MSHKDVSVLAITDLETTGLDLSHDYVLEVATILVTMDLVEIARFERVIEISDAGMQRMRLNELVVRMHSKSGLLGEVLLTDNTIESVEADWMTFLFNAVPESTKIAVAGSGVGHFDLGWIQQEFPRVHERVVYFPYDIGDFRRITDMFNHGKSVIPPVEESFVDGIKVHRAMADAQAHYEEFMAYRDWFVRSGLETTV